MCGALWSANVVLLLMLVLRHGLNKKPDAAAGTPSSSTTAMAPEHPAAAHSREPK